jgi:hypothetical protein
MNDKSVKRLHSYIAWTGPVCLVTFFASWIALSHNFPPPDPRYTGPELVANYYGKYRSGIMLGMSLAACFGMLYLPFTCLLSARMMEREKVPVLALMQLCGGALTAWILVMCPCIWVYCAEGANTLDPELIKTLHFVAWYIFNMTYMITTIQCVSIGIFTLMDTKTPRLFPAWCGWLSIIIGLSFSPLTYLPYVKTGPFAINGWWAFHLVVVGFGTFTSTFSYYLLNDIKRPRISASPGIGQAIGNRS